MDFDLENVSGLEAYRLMTASIIPRPIAWVSTQSKDGVLNLAPFSYFMAVGSRPPMLMIAVGDRDGYPKDTAANIIATRELVVNFPTVDLAERMVHTSANCTADVNEFELAGLTPVESKTVRVPGVDESPLRMECTLHDVLRPGGNPISVIFAVIKHIYVHDNMLGEDGLPDPEKCNPVCRLGRQQYAALGDIFTIDRPE